MSGLEILLGAVVLKLVTEVFDVNTMVCVSGCFS